MVSRRLTGLPGSSQFNAFEQVPLGGGTNAVKLVNPLAGRAFDLEGTDSHKLAIGPFPSVASQDLADQAVELSSNGLSLVDYTIPARMRAKSRSTAKSKSSPQISVRRATSRVSTGGRVRNGAFGSGRQRRSASCAIRATTTRGENFEGFQITTFDGDRITVRGSPGTGADAAPGPVSVIWLVDAHCHILPHRGKGPDRWRRCR
jgi:hypothetical protein